MQLKQVWAKSSHVGLFYMVPFLKAQQTDEFKKVFTHFQQLESHLIEDLDKIKIKQKFNEVNKF